MRDFHNLVYGVLCSPLTFSFYLRVYECSVQLGSSTLSSPLTRSMLTQTSRVQEHKADKFEARIKDKSVERSSDDLTVHHCLNVRCTFPVYFPSRLLFSYFAAESDSFAFLGRSNSFESISSDLRQRPNHKSAQPRIPNEHIYTTWLRRLSASTRQF